jgi:hypothetical protein
MIIREKILFPDLIESIESQFLCEKFLESDLAENFTIYVARALESTLTFLDFFLIWLERYSLITS